MPEPEDTKDYSDYNAKLTIADFDLLKVRISNNLEQECKYST